MCVCTNSICLSLGLTSHRALPRHTPLLIQRCGWIKLHLPSSSPWPLPTLGQARVRLTTTTSPTPCTEHCHVIAHPRWLESTSRVELTTTNVNTTHKCHVDTRVGNGWMETHQVRCRTNPVICGLLAHPQVKEAMVNRSSLLRQLARHPDCLPHRLSATSNAPTMPAAAALFEHTPNVNLLYIQTYEIVLELQCSPTSLCM